MLSMRFQMQSQWWQSQAAVLVGAWTELRQEATTDIKEKLLPNQRNNPVTSSPKSYPFSLLQIIMHCKTLNEIYRRGSPPSQFLSQGLFKDQKSSIMKQIKKTMSW